MPTIKFGKIEETRVLDNNGSTIREEVNIRESIPTMPIRKHYEIKKKVYNQEQEHSEYIQFSDDLAKDKTMLDPAFRIEHSVLGDQTGYYFVIWCYTRLEY